MDLAWVEDLAWAGGWASVGVEAMRGVGTGRGFPIVDILIEDTVFTILTVVPMGRITPICLVSIDRVFLPAAEWCGIKNNVGRCIMPGFNGTGPRGLGPMTGGGRGFCNPRGMGRGYGVGGRAPYAGIGRGLGFGAPYAQPVNKEEEIELLRGDAEEIKNQLEQIEARIGELEK